MCIYIYTVQTLACIKIHYFFTVYIMQWDANTANKKTSVLQMLFICLLNWKQSDHGIY